MLMGCRRGLHCERPAWGCSVLEGLTHPSNEGNRKGPHTYTSSPTGDTRRAAYMTNLLTRVPKSAQPRVATMVRRIYQQPCAEGGALPIR